MHDRRSINLSNIARANPAVSKLVYKTVTLFARWNISVAALPHWTENLSAQPYNKCVTWCVLMNIETASLVDGIGKMAVGEIVFFASPLNANISSTVH